MLILWNVVVLKKAFINGEPLYELSLVITFLLVLGLLNMRQSKLRVLREYPLVGYLYYLIVGLRSAWKEGYLQTTNLLRKFWINDAASGRDKSDKDKPLAR